MKELHLNELNYTDTKPEHGTVRSVTVHAPTRGSLRHAMGTMSSQTTENLMYQRKIVTKWYTRCIKAGNVHLMLRVEIEREVTR